MSEFLVDLHLRAMLEGRVVPLLGAGVNLCGRPPDVEWTPGQTEYLPNGGELAAYLADYFSYPPGDARDLQRVSQYVSVTAGPDWLYDKLHDLFALEYAPGPLHRFLAAFPRRMREKGRDPAFQLIVTTNYDDALERAFREAGEPFDLLWYVAEGKEGGKFKHQPPGGEVRLVDIPNKYDEVSTDERTVILKIHGAVHADDRDADSFVITEDHYIDFLTHGADVSTLVPILLAEKMKDSHFLFLGYSLRDWNLRVILRRIWRERTRGKKSWALQLSPQEFDKKFWVMQDIDILELDLDDYVARLDERLEQLAGVGAPA